MMKIVIIEDEIPAREKLKRFIKELQIPVEIAAEINSVEAAVAFLKTTEVDLIISDIELQDGNAFDIYQQVSLSCPIIFTTAYDQFWMNAFESNGIDYLMKPFSKDRFQKAWSKFLSLRNSVPDKTNFLNNLTKLIDQTFAEKKYKKRFTVHTHHGLYFLDIENVVFFEANDGVIFAFDNMGKKHLLNYATLKELEPLLSPSDFFRINRNQLISKQHIEKIERFTKNILAIKMKGYKEYHKTSQSNTSILRKWIDE
jgi:DNA-binding LytR/AlgR family response regulator